MRDRSPGAGWDMHMRTVVDKEESTCAFPGIFSWPVWASAQRNHCSFFSTSVAPDGFFISALVSGDPPGLGGGDTP